MWTPDGPGYPKKKETDEKSLGYATDAQVKITQSETAPPNQADHCLKEFKGLTIMQSVLPKLLHLTCLEPLDAQIQELLNPALW